MRIEYLECILLTAERKSISAAARELFIQQTTLSSAIKSAGTELCIQIFSRFHNGVELTYDGSRCLLFIKNIVSAYQRLQETSADKPEQFLIYAYPHTCDNYTMELLRLINSTIPDVPVSVIERSSSSLVEHLVSDQNVKIGIGICSEDELPQYYKKAVLHNVTLEFLGHTNIRMYVCSDSIHAGKACVDISELSGEHLVFESCDLERYYQNKLDKYIPKHTVLSNSHLIRLAVLNCGYVGLSCDISVMPQCRRFPPWRNCGWLRFLTPQCSPQLSSIFWPTTTPAN